MADAVFETASAGCRAPGKEVHCREYITVLVLPIGRSPIRGAVRRVVRRSDGPLRPMNFAVMRRP